jgi:hypothetical protein
MNEFHHLKLNRMIEIIKALPKQRPFVEGESEREKKIIKNSSGSEFTIL